MGVLPLTLDAARGAYPTIRVAASRVQGKCGGAPTATQVQNGSCDRPAIRLSFDTTASSLFLLLFAAAT